MGAEGGDSCRRPRGALEDVAFFDDFELLESGGRRRDVSDLESPFRPKHTDLRAHRPGLVLGAVARDDGGSETGAEAR